MTVLLAAILLSSPLTTDVADRAVTGDVTVVNISWAFAGGTIDWRFNPTATKGPFNPEWTWQLNRMCFWTDLARCYKETGNEKYAQAFACQLVSWLDQTGGVPPEADYNGVGSPWRTIEEGLRLMGSWRDAWLAFRNSPSFSADLQVRFRSAALAQARHLMRHPSSVGNWLLIEMSGAYAFATDFPDNPESPAIRREASRRLVKAVREQVLPDGLQYELSPDYHSVALTCAFQMYAKAAASGLLDELPLDYGPLLERMADAVLAMTTPSLVQPRFNDCFTMCADQIVGPMVSLFPEREDFAWLASRRKRGNPPAGETASRYLPWSGFAVMRSDWGSDATYLCFDVGPLGQAHYHQDKLSFTLWKGGEELVFDDGGGQYEESEMRRYAVSGYDHNTLLVDGLGQFRGGPLRATAPIDAGWISTMTYDRAFGIYDQGFGPKELRLATQRREIVFDRASDQFTVTDVVETKDGGLHDYELVFQLDTTNVTVSADGRRLRADYGLGRRWALEMSFLGADAVTPIVARREPTPAGWFVGRNDNSVRSATTVFVKASERRNHTFMTKLKAIRVTLTR